jgi:hypothetical protein
MFHQVQWMQRLGGGHSFHQDELELSSLDHSITPDGLALALIPQFRQSGQHQNLDEAISLLQGRFHLQHAHYPCESSSLHGLTDALHTWF